MKRKRQGSDVQATSSQTLVDLTHDNDGDGDVIDLTFDSSTTSASKSVGYGASVTPANSDSLTITHTTAAITSKGLFSGSSFLFIPINIPKAQMSILQNAVLRRGANILESVPPAPTYIVSNTNLPKTLAHLHCPALPEQSKLVPPEFISDSIKKGSLSFSKEIHPRQDEALMEVKSGSETEPCADEEAAKRPRPLLDDVAGVIGPPSTKPVDIVKASSPPAMQDDTESHVGTETESDFSVETEEDISAQNLTPSKAHSILFEDPDRVSSDESLTEEDETVEKVPIGKKLKNQESWACMRRAPSVLDDSNKNAHITDEFQRLVKRAEADGDQWRVISYRKAINILKKLPAIRNVEEVNGIKGIGSQMRKKIGEVLRTGFIRKAHNIPENLETLELFQNIYGVGKKIARQLLAKGYRTLEDVKSWPGLTPTQELGIKYYHDFLERIPRDECTAILKFVEKHALELDPELEVTMMGSYRRGSPTCGDVDFIVTHTDGTSHIGILPKLLVNLRKTGFLLEDLSSSYANETHPIYKGVCRLPGYKTARRIDILIVPYDQLGAALIYFTGNEAFNRSIRHLAHKKGMSLNQHGLFSDVVRDRSGEKMHGGHIIASRTEQEIFDALGVPWRPPTERNL